MLNDQTNIVTLIISSKFEEDPGTLDLILDFIEGISPRIQRIESAMNSLDFLKLKDEAHKFCGSSGLYGFVELESLTSKLESSAQNHSTHLCREIVEKIRHAYLGILAGIDLMK